MEKSNGALQKLNDVYRCLLWESNVMLTLCSETTSTPGIQVFAKDEIDALLERGRLFPSDAPGVEATSNAQPAAELPAAELPAAELMENGSGAPTNAAIDASISQAPPKVKPPPVVVKQLKPVIALSSR